MTKAYFIGQITITNPAGYAHYAALVPQTIADGGGRYLVRGGTASQLEGMSHGDRHVVLEFASRSEALAWYHGEAYQAILPQRQQNSSGELVLVDGYLAT